MSEKNNISVMVFKKLLQYAKPYRSYLFISLFCTLAIAFVGPFRPMIIGDMIRKYVIETKDQYHLLLSTLFVIGLLVIEVLSQFFGSYFSNLLAQSIIRDIRIKLYKHISSFKMQYFDKTPIGSLVTRVVSDMGAISEIFSSGLIDIMGDILSLLVLVTFMFISNWKLSLLILVPIPILIYATKIFAKAMQKSFQAERIQVNKLNTFVQERITGMSIVQMFAREKKEMQAFEEINKDHRQAHINAVWAFSIFLPVVELLSSLSIAFILVFSAFMISGDTVETLAHKYNEVIEFTLWVQMIYRPIRQLADKFNILQRGTVRAERVFEILDDQSPIQKDGSVYKCDFNQPIRFQNVSFAFIDENWVLNDINFTIEKGETIAFVGATGSGKSSIVNLLGRFYEYQKGDIYIGNTKITDIQLEYLRKNIAIVLQDVFLFSDTIHNNITLGDATITREQVIDAAKQVGAHDFISKLPNGYDYQIGERGGVLSVGQRQLLAFIRAYLYNPSILILDEATSSVDNESELLIQQATEKLTQGRTSIIIAHRLSTIQKANKIIVLNKGIIIEQGSHSELLKQNGAYKTLYDKQFTTHE